jgi:hypothetical protein
MTYHLYSARQLPLSSIYCLSLFFARSQCIPSLFFRPLLIYCVIALKLTIRIFPMSKVTDLLRSSEITTPFFAVNVIL